MISSVGNTAGVGWCSTFPVLSSVSLVCPSLNSATYVFAPFCSIVINRVAGPPGLAKGIPPSDFRLFTWNGLASGAPQERGVSLTNLLPEGIVELPPVPWTSNSTVQLVSDNGIALYYGDGIEAKFLPIPQFKKFRSDWVALGPVVTSQPILRSVQCVGGGCVLNWYSVAGLTYRVQSKFALTNGAWSNVAGDVTASGALASKSISMGATQQFFRVVIP